MKSNEFSTGMAWGGLLSLCVVLLAAATSFQPNPPQTGISTGPAVAVTCSDITAGSVVVATFSEWVRYSTIQNLSSNDLEIEALATTTGRASCNAVVAAGATVQLAVLHSTIAIKNIGAGTADLNGADRTVIISGWR